METVFFSFVLKCKTHKRCKAIKLYPQRYEKPVSYYSDTAIDHEKFDSSSGI
jgi:hypothetical protein